MNRISAVAVLAALGFAVGGCGSAKNGGSALVVINTVDTNSPSGTIVVTGKKTFANLPVGTPIACKGGEPVVNVPAGDAAVGATESSIGVVSGTSPRMELTRSLNGTVMVSCSRK